MARLFLYIVFVLYGASLLAVPAKREWYAHRQPDGTILQVMLCGDERNHYYRTTDNIPLVRDADGHFCYAETVGCTLVSTGVLAHNIHERNEKEQSILPCDADVASLQFAAKPRPLIQDRTLKRLAMTRTASDGNPKKGLVVMVEFSDRSFSSDTASVVWGDILNKNGYSENGAQGSVHDYFMDQSNGAFNLTFDVVGPVKLPKSRYYYGKNNPMNSNDIDINMSELIVESCNAIDEDVDFRDYDWDNDGYVDQVFFLYAGWNEAVSGADSRLIWPHEYWLSGYSDYPLGIVVDGVKIDQYACSSELTGVEDTAPQLSGLGTFCHEFSHCLGLPDFYTYTGRELMGEWDLLSYGSYNGDGWCPPNYTSYERAFCGWQEPEVLHQPVSIAGMEALGNGGMTYKIVNDALSSSADEYYLLENRQRKGWDSCIPGSGLLIIHVDYDYDSWYNNIVNDVYSHPRMTVIPANNIYRDNVAAMHAFPYNANDSLTDMSIPAAKVYNANANGYKMGKPITNIRKYGDGLVAFDFMGGETGNTGIVGVEAIQQQQYEGVPAIVYDVNGRMLYSTSSFSKDILPCGAYIIRFDNGNKLKLIK